MPIQTYLHFNKRNCQIAILNLTIILTQFAAIPTFAQDGKEPMGGQPPKGSITNVKDFDYQVKYQRAFEAVMWSLPATAIYAFRRSAYADLGYQDNDILTYSGTAKPNLEAITPNSSTPYIGAYGDLQKGPVVLEVPAEGPEGSLYGQVVDAWQFTIADVGPSGIDKGKGGKYLFTAPGYKGKIPPGYFHISSPNYRIAFAFRSVPAPGKSIDDAFKYAQRLKMYFLTQANNPPKQRFIDPLNNRYSTLPVYDETYFQDLYHIVSVEPVKEQDKVMMGMLASLGIQKGKPFTPDENTKNALRQGAMDAWNYLQYWFDNLPSSQLYWPDRHYVSLMQTDSNRTFTYVYPDRIDLINRAAQFAWCTYVPKVLSNKPATQYLMAMADAEGKHLMADKLYKVDVPANMPVNQFWALSVYDRATFAFIYSNTGRTTLSSYDIPKMKKNADGSITIYVGPKAPEGFESNWIPTTGKRPLPAMRLYGGTDDLFSKKFKMPDFVPVN